MRVLLALLCGALLAANVAPQNTRHAEYVVELKDPARRSFHVTTVFHNLRQPSLDLSLPVWTPGVYAVENYAANISGFTARDAAGAIRGVTPQPSTWRVDSAGSSDITIEFDYLAAMAPGWNRAAITDGFAFFTGTELFLGATGRSRAASTVRFVVPPGWRIASALRETADPLVYEAADYDELVDAATVLGSFDVVRFDIDGTPHDFVTVPAASYERPNVDAFLGKVPDVLRTQRSIFGSLPYDKYLFFYFSPSTGFTGGNLEHANSSIYSGPDALGDTDLGSVAHEFFHLWNVKRIRPAEMWPYDYSRVPAVPSLWVSEGITSYYERLTLLRAGISKVSLPVDGTGPDGERLRPVLNAESAFLQDLAYRLSGVETNPQRRTLPATHSSMAYGKGHVLGALLDLSILHDTSGTRGLDDVMRALHTQHYLQSTGFTHRDVVQIVSATARRDYTGFFDRYVTGVETPPYDAVFGRAGYRLVQSARTLGVLAIAARSTPDGRTIYRFADPDGPAAVAGLRVGDVILAVDGVPIHDVPLANLFGLNWIGGRFLGKAGARVVLRIRRGAAEQNIAVILGTRTETTFALESVPAPTVEQLALRRAWLRR